MTLIIALDKAGNAHQPAKSAFIRARKAENGYARQLRKIARHIGDLINTMWVPDDMSAADQISDAMARYAKLLEPWAASAAKRMITEVAARDKQAWREKSAEMGRLLRAEMNDAPIGAVFRQRMADQVGLITSLPLDAAERVHKLTMEGIVQGTRAKAIAAEIMRSGEVTKSRADLIARTEVGRTATEITRARAVFVGSTHFKWLSVGDSDVRPGHRRLNGKIFAWNDPPECDPGHHALPGCIWNCRCVAIPQID